MNISTSSFSRSWQVLLIGGASGSGKTSVSYRLARHFETGITEVDDFQVLLECMTTPEQQPALHYWRTHPEWVDQPVEQTVEQLIAIGRAMTPALEAIIANHIETQQPVVLEGDFILPALATRGEWMNTGLVQAIFLYEPDEEQLLKNYLQREPENDFQHRRARVSRLYGEWLKQEAEQYGLSVIPARPWADLLERILAVVH